MTQVPAPTSPPAAPGAFAALRRRYARLSPDMRRRLPALALTLAIEVLLVLMLLSLGSAKREIAEMRDTLVAFTSPEAQDEPDEAPSPEPARPQPPAASSAAAPRERQAAPSPAAPQPAAPPPILRNDFSLESVPRTSQSPAAKAPQAYGPAFTPAPGDTPQIAGSGPNGEPLYAARWYRRPYDDELAGYLSTAQGPGWGLIDCRTAPDFRVEDCVVVGESPRGSGLGKAVQAAAWQFKVRPPQRGGRPMVGEWVRIRIDYQLRPRADRFEG
ncbi:MAG: hypothetical protein QGF48_08865 [Qipengyuania citrea]|nr:hypothetical protein [Qipengyuania citrea]